MFYYTISGLLFQYDCCLSVPKTDINYYHPLYSVLTH